jgi:hypothetical protein
MVAQLTGGASAMPEASGKDFKERRVGAGIVSTTYQSVLAMNIFRFKSSFSHEGDI